MYRFILAIFFIMSSLSSLTASGQQRLQYFFRHLNQTDGLLNDQVISITQDGKGYIWIATTSGLQRYDGSRFNYYAEMLSDPSQGLTYGADIYADKTSNSLWIKKKLQLEKMVNGKNSFTMYDPEKIAADPDFNLATYKGCNNEKWLVGNQAVFEYDPILKKNNLYFAGVFPKNATQASSLSTDSLQNQTWAALGHQLILFDKKSGQAYSKAYNPYDHPLLRTSFYEDEKEVLRFVMKDRDQNIWVTSWGDAFFKYDHETKTITRFSLSAIKKTEQNKKINTAVLLINCMLEDDYNNIWIGTENAGLLKYNKANGQFDYCTVQEKHKESLQYNYKIFSLFQDNEQNIWVGTDQGISIFNPYRQYFKSIRHEDDDPLSMNESEIAAFIQTSDADMYIGTWGGGIAVYDSSFHFKKNLFQKEPSENNFVWSLLQPDDKSLWIGCQSGHLMIYDILKGSTQYLQPEALDQSTIRCMVEDKKKNIWFGLNNGKIAKWDQQQKMFFPYNGAKPTGTVFNIFFDKAQQCWVSTDAGFKQFDTEKMIFCNTWLPDKNNASAISAKTCQGIEEYNDSLLVIGTIYGGLNFFNKKTKTFSHLNMADGFPSNSIYAVKKDESGHIWFTTDYGLYNFTGGGKKITTFSLEPGVLNASFAAANFYPLQDGQWVTFTQTNTISFHPQRIITGYDKKLKAEITGFKVFDKPLYIDSLLLNDEPLRLSYKENFFTIEFAALRFSNLQQTNYYYRLAGVDKNWVNGGTKPFANYTDLQPGEYTFEVKAENDNIDGEAGFLKIIIDAPFWQTSWFRILLTLLSIAIIGLLVVKRISNIRHEAALKHRIAETEMMALRAQMNPHFIFNCINSIDALIQSNDKYQATVYLNKFAKMIRNVLDSSKQNVVTLSKDMETLLLYIDLEKFRNENKFTVDIDADKTMLQDDYKIPPLIIQPYVENAILHGLKNRMDNKGKLLISVKKQEGRIHFIIEDNGVGRGVTANLRKNEKKSYGMQTSSDRVKLFNNESIASVLITDLEKDDRPAGTKVEVFLNI